MVSVDFSESREATLFPRGGFAQKLESSVETPKVVRLLRCSLLGIDAPEPNNLTTDNLATSWSELLGEAPRGYGR
jgi:hypothetical protein